ncbi:hypothetical protein BCR39DRAFT_586233 [Naematelia encephala]|uniref:Uncharacterized protein n=1 Tax=Naematelia encephala TaxID=71784 RepID=A0A1Y2BHH2_9TREE|nr:hypothetical protein BCR39DRAFT_586233 [Naematelia encephala]
METPTTRSRAKREAEASTPEDVGSIAWIHDQRLRQAVIAATMNDYMEPPTPTQKPRPITSRPIHGNDPSSSSSAPPRKRRCRPHHSLPQPLTTSSFSSTGTNPNNRAGPSSAPAGGPSSSRLDELLGEAMAAFAIKPSELVQTPPRSYQTASRSIHTPVTLPPSSSVLQVSSKENRHPDAGSSSKMRPKPTSKPSEVDANQSSKRSVSSVSPTKPGAAPRIGLRHNQRLAGPNQRALKPSGTSEIRPVQPMQNNSTDNGHCQNTISASSNDSRPPSRPGQKTFKPPLIAVQPIRSSPRRHTSLSDASHSAHHGIFNPLRKAAVNTSSPVPVRKQAAKAKAAPSSDGLDADDSFDGIFQGGGPEVEMLLRTVDGSQ